MKSALWFLLLFTSFSLKAQEVRKAVISVDTSISTESFTIPFSDIVVMDARFDRSKIGCIYNTTLIGMQSSNKKNAVFPDSFHYYFPSFLKTFISTDESSSEQLLILVKEFRITDHFLNGIKGGTEVQHIMNISASFYQVKNGAYRKLFSVNNIMQQNIYKALERKRKFEEGTRPTALRTMLYKLLHNQSWKVNEAGPAFILADIQNGMEKRFALPLFTQPLVKGAYASFSEFTNNKPSITANFIYVRGKLSKLVDDKGKEIATDNIWGVYDGKQAWLRCRGEFVELMPCDRSFRVLSYRTDGELRGSFLSGALPPPTSKNREYFDLNMETGKLYLEELFGKSVTGAEHFQ